MNELEQRKERWAGFGEKFASVELELQAKHQAIIKGVAMPTNAEEVLDYEIQLSMLKETFAAIVEKRKTITKTFDELHARLSEPEKKLKQFIDEYASGIVTIKKTEQERVAKEQARQKEIQRVTGLVQKYVIETQEAYEKKIQEQILKAYTWALNSGQVNKENLEEYVKKCSEKFTLVDFAPTKPRVESSLDEQTLNTLTEFRFDSNKYLAKYREQLADKFLLFELDLKNKEDAIRNAELEKQLSDEAEKVKAHNAKLAAEVSARAESMVITEDFKPLKSTYKLDMPNDYTSLVWIIGAFLANLEECKKHVRVKNILGLSVEQMGDALAKCKNNDDKFQPMNIVFKTVEKL